MKGLYVETVLSFAIFLVIFMYSEFITYTVIFDVSELPYVKELMYADLIGIY